tara:strand:- start:154 stop:348 length:195 start_codon:yes stop_codon:yes gene_type:complete
MKQNIFLLLTISILTTFFYVDLSKENNAILKGTHVVEKNSDVKNLIYNDNFIEYKDKLYTEVVY